MVRFLAMLLLLMVTHSGSMLCSVIWVRFFFLFIYVLWLVSLCLIIIGLDDSLLPTLLLSSVSVHSTTMLFRKRLVHSFDMLCSWRQVYSNCNAIPVLLVHSFDMLCSWSQAHSIEVLFSTCLVRFFTTLYSRSKARSFSIAIF